MRVAGRAESGNRRAECAALRRQCLLQLAIAHVNSGDRVSVLFCHGSRPSVDSDLAMYAIVVVIGWKNFGSRLLPLLVLTFRVAGSPG